MATIITTYRLDLRGLDHFEAWSAQFPFAISHGLNKTGQKAARRLRSTLKDYFVDRGKASDYVKRRLTIVKVASKSDLSIWVASADDFMRAHAEGGGDPSRPEGRSQLGAIPLAMRHDPKRGLGKRNEWPMELIRQGKAYRAGIDHLQPQGTKTSARTGKTRRVTRRGAAPPLEAGQVIRASARNGAFQAGEPLWLIAEDDKIKLAQDWPMAELVEAEFADSWEAQLITSMRFAIKTARTGRLR